MFRFVWRNPAYATKNWRRLAAVRRAMAQHRSLYPICEWCKTTKRIEVHHKLPVSVAPERAAESSNLYSLCRACHLAIGHIGNWRRYVGNLETVCLVADRVRIIKQA